MQTKALIKTSYIERGGANFIYIGNVQNTNMYINKQQQGFENVSLDKILSESLSNVTRRFEKEKQPLTLQI